MNARTAVIALVFAACLPGRLAGAMEISTQTADSIKILVPGDALPGERHAGEELKTFLEEAVGAALEIVADEKPGALHIRVGQSPRTRELLPEVGWDALGPEEIIIKTAANGDLVLSGGRPRGALYAVYAFLEDVAGVRFWTSRETQVPKHETLAVPRQDVRYNPPVFSRVGTFHDFRMHPEFAARLRINRIVPRKDPMPESIGGGLHVIGGQHTFEGLYFPAAEYLATHPEWFSLINGKRVGGNHTGNLCLTNPELLEAMKAKVLDILRQDPDPRMIDISQNDGTRELCQCEPCKAAIAEEGAQSGLLLRFVNAVAEAVEKEFPQVKLLTYAYEFTSDPPKLVRPRSNVVINLVASDTWIHQPLYAPENRIFGQRLEAWSRIAREVQVWHNMANFANWLLPMPNLGFYGPEIRYLVDRNTTSILYLNDYGSGGTAGDFVGLKAYVIAKLMWNPSLDANAVIDEYLDGYYGPAAGRILRRYLDFMGSELVKNGGGLDNQNASPSVWLSHASLQKAGSLLEEAAALVKDDPVLAGRVEIASLPARFAWLERYHWILALGEMPKAKLPLGGDISAFTDECERLGRKYGIAAVTERPPLFEGYIKNMREQQTALLGASAPPEFVKSSRKPALVLDKGFWKLAYRLPHEQAEWVDDPAASDGRTLRMGSGKESWWIQSVLHPGLKGQKWRVHVRARADTDAPDGPAMQVGVYDRLGKKMIGKPYYAPGKMFAKDEYRWIDCGVYAMPSPSLPQVYLSPVATPGFRNVFVDRIALTRE